LAEVFLSHEAQTRLHLFLYKIFVNILKPFIPPFYLLVRYLEYSQPVNMKLLVFVMAALALRVAAAPIEIETADVADVANVGDVAESLEPRDNWCHHAGITCW
jgi:hypothetical protein